MKAKPKSVYLVIDKQYPSSGSWYSSRAKAIRVKNILQADTGVNTVIFIVRKALQEKK